MNNIVTLGNLEKNYGIVVGINQGTTKNGKSFTSYYLVNELPDREGCSGYSVQTVFDWENNNYGINLGDHVLFAFSQGEYQRIIYVDVIQNPFEKKGAAK